VPRHRRDGLLQWKLGRFNFGQSLSTLPLTIPWSSIYTQQWDLNTGQTVRSFTAHGAQIATVAMRPVAPPSLPRSPSPMDTTPATVHMNGTEPKAEEEAPTATPEEVPSQADVSMNSDAKSEASYDPLFDDPVDEMDGTPSLSLAPPDPFAGLISMGSSWPASSPSAAPPAPVHPMLPRQPVKLAPKMPPLLDASTSPDMSADLLMTASIDGQVMLWDKRVASHTGPGSRGVGRLEMNSGTPPWCVSVNNSSYIMRHRADDRVEHQACWSANGSQIYAGRRNGTIDVWDVRNLGFSGPKSTPRLMKTIRNPPSSGMVACVVAFPDGKHIAW
jgi:transcriptional activator SPT8